jgi:hypothetical protein
MNTYKITNVTNTAGKRDPMFNSVLNIDYVDAMMKKTITIKPGEMIYLQISTLPLSVHRLRVKKLINVVEISRSELKNAIDASNKRKLNKEVPVEVVETVEEVKTTQSKRKTKKETTDAE